MSPSLPFHTLRLPNRLRVILSPLHETQAVTALVLCKVGSRYESAQINGASHFLEHLVFKGTEKRPTTLDISKELDAIGAEYNAFTAKDHTGYYVKAAAEHLETSLDVLSDMLFHALFDPKEIERERGVILQEINMYEDNPMMSVEDLFEEVTFRGHPLGRNIAGPKAVIKRVKRADLLRFRERFYEPGNIVVSLAGKLPKSTPQLLAKYFTETQGGRRTFPAYQRFRVRQRRPQLKVKTKDTEQVQLVMGFPSYPLEHPRLFPLYVLNVILGGNMSSRLFIAIRERKGLCYFIRSSASPYQDTGTFSIQAGLDRRRLEEAVKGIVEELVRLRDEGPTKDELAKAKSYLKGKFILQLEDSEHIANFFGRQATLSSHIRTPKENLRRIERVTLDDVRRTSRELIRSDRSNLALIGPVEDSARLQSLLRFD